VRIVGGELVRDWKPVTDAAVLERLDEAARGHVLQADLKAQGLTDFGELSPRGFGRPGKPAALELFFQDKPMPLAGWPNDGWSKIAATPAGAEGGKFAYEGDRPARWTKAPDAWLLGYWTFDWADSYVKVKAIDPQARQVATEPPHGAFGYKKGQRWRALNLLEELDQPGEWYLDRPTGLLYFWPPAPIESGRPTVSVLGKLVLLNSASHITLRGLLLECGRDTGVVATGGKGVLVAGCTIRNVGAAGVGLYGCRESGVVGCDIYETGEGGIALVGGDRRTLEPGKLFARNNHIHHFSRWCRTYRPAVDVRGVGHTVSHNLIHDSPHCGILFGGNDHTIEFNEIHHVCQETGDVGAFYTGRDWTARGTVIRHNYFHDIHGPGELGAMGVYLDDGASGITIVGNVFVRASRAAFVGGGRDNVVENNVFIECQPAVHVDARCLNWAKDKAARGGEWGMYKKLEDVRFDQPPYSEKYPALGKMLGDDPAAPKGNVVARNVCLGPWLDLEGQAKPFVAFEDNLTEGDPGFVDAARLNFQPKGGSPAEKIGFKPIPMEKIGLAKDAYRRDVPARP
jgi:hypothetical protein